MAKPIPQLVITLDDTPIMRHALEVLAMALDSQVRALQEHPDDAVRERVETSGKIVAAMRAAAVSSP